MKILLVTKQQKHAQFIKDNCKNPIDLFVYDDPFKAIENLPIIVPQAIIISAHDFTRHWKPLLVVYKDLMPDGLFYLIIDAPMHKSELRKARSMSISGIVPTFDDPQSVKNESLEQLKTYAAELDNSPGIAQQISRPIHTASILVEIPPITQLFPVTARHLQDHEYLLQFETPMPAKYVVANKMIHITFVSGDVPLYVSVPIQRIDGSGGAVVTCDLSVVASY